MSPPVAFFETSRFRFEPQHKCACDRPLRRTASLRSPMVVTDHVTRETLRSFRPAAACATGGLFDCDLSHSQCGRGHRRSAVQSAPRPGGHGAKPRARAAQQFPSRRGQPGGLVFELDQPQPAQIPHDLRPNRPHRAAAQHPRQRLSESAGRVRSSADRPSRARGGAWFTSRESAKRSSEWTSVMRPSTARAEESDRNATLRQRYEFDACLTRRMTSAMQQQRG